jgi:hypothetical protein
MNGNMIDQDLLIESRKRLDGIAKRGYERSLALNDEAAVPRESLTASFSRGFNAFAAAVNYLKLVVRHSATQ